MRLLKFAVGPTCVSFSYSRRTVLGYRGLDKDSGIFSAGRLAQEDLEKFELQGRPTALDLSLWAPFVDSQLISTQGLSLWDRFCLKRQVSRHHPSFVVKSLSSLQVRTSESRQLVVTTASLSEMSQQLLKKVEQWNLPVRSLRVQTVSVPRFLLKQVTGVGPWRGCLFMQEQTLFFSLAFVSARRRPRLLITRPLPLAAEWRSEQEFSLDPNFSALIAHEIAQSVEYVSRKIGQGIHHVDILTNSECPTVKAEDFPESLTVTLSLAGTEPAPSSAGVDLRTPSLQKLHGEYKVGHFLKVAACILGVCSGGAILQHSLFINQQHHYQKTLSSSCSSMSRPEEALYRQQDLSCRLAFLEARARQSWVESHSFELLGGLLSAVQKQGTLCSFTGEQKIFEVDPRLKEGVSLGSVPAVKKQGISLTLTLRVKPYEATMATTEPKGERASLVLYQRHLAHSLKSALSKPGNPPFSLVSFVDYKEGMVTVRASWGSPKTAAAVRRSPRKPKATSISCLLKSYGENDGGGYVHTS